MLYIEHCLLILPLFVAICEIWLPRLTYGVYLVLSLKPGATSSVNHIEPPFVSSDSHLLWKLMTKGERLYKNMKALGGRDWNKEVEVGHGHGQRGSNIEEKRWIKILGQEKHTSRGSKLMNFDWLHLKYAYSCACLHLHKF